MLKACSRRPIWSSRPWALRARQSRPAG
jgi:hypothetical protein